MTTQYYLDIELRSNCQGSREMAFSSLKSAIDRDIDEYLQITVIKTGQLMQVRCSPCKCPNLKDFLAPRDQFNAEHSTEGYLCP